MFLSTDEQTIIAQCTPKGSGAIALLRLSGADAIEIASHISTLANNKKITTVASHTIHYGSVVSADQKIIDKVMFIVMHAPRTFTGQNIVEITAHNNQFLVEEIIALAIKHGARLAQQGEFARRAVLNEKIDLVQAEAINELIHANTQLALKKSLAQLDGSFSHWINSIEQKLIKALALSEASFEFIDEEDLEFNQQINSIIANTLDTIAQLKQAFDQQQQIRQGIRIAIIGSVNAGKSSLFNALLKKDRAIVTNIAGTTRDVIEAGLYKNNNYWTLIDTAGLRQANDIIEQKGIERSYKEAELADIILLVVDGSRAMSRQEQLVYHELYAQHADKIIVIKNKSDLEQALLKLPTTKYLTSSRDDIESINAIECSVQEKITALFNELESPFLLNQRQFNLLLGLESKLLAMQPLFETSPDYEIISFHLNDAIAHLSELTGKSISEAGMDAVFKSFCVGK